MAIERLKFNYKAQKYNLDQSTVWRPYKEPQTQCDQSTDMTQNSEHMYLIL